MKEVASQSTAAAARIAVLLEEIASAPEIVECLTEDGRSSAGRRFDVQYLAHTRRSRLNLWRLKCSMQAPVPTTRLLPYRLIYAVDAPEMTVIGMGLMPRPPENYDANSPRFQRIAREYASLNIPLLPQG